MSLIEIVSCVCEREKGKENIKQRKTIEPAKNTCHVPFIVKLKYVRTI